jgi:hypothetical protein
MCLLEEVLDGMPQTSAVAPQVIMPETTAAFERATGAVRHRVRGAGDGTWRIARPTNAIPRRGLLLSVSEVSLHAPQLDDAIGDLLVAASFVHGTGNRAIPFLRRR